MEYPEFRDNISMALTPMVYTARLVKKEHPNAKVVFIGPCAAKKLEASRKSVRSDVDFVLTFEETYGMFVAKSVDFNTLKEKPLDDKTTAAGRGFAVMGGVAQAVVTASKTLAPDREIPVYAAQGLDNCRSMLKLAKMGKFDGYLLEGMACPMGCVSGAGTVESPTKVKALVGMSQKEANKKSSVESEYKDLFNKLD